MINLTKGQKLNLTKDAGISNAIVGLGWKLNASARSSAKPVDLDAMAFMLVNSNGRPTCPKEDFFCFFGQKNTIGGAVALSGDDLDGGDGVNADEEIKIDFAKVAALAPEVTEISIFVNVYDAHARGQNFGMLESAFLRIAKTSGEIVCRYELKNEFPTATSVQIGSFTKDASGNWIFEAIGTGYNKTLAEIIQAYGLSA